MDGYSYPIFFLPLFLEWLPLGSIGWTIGDRRGPIVAKRVKDVVGTIYGSSGNAKEVVGMIVGFGSSLDPTVDERVMKSGCFEHEDSPEDEITVHGGTPMILCERSMSITAIGNRICNGRLNVPAYGFDSGDCCLPELQCVSPYHALIFNISYFW